MAFTMKEEEFFEKYLANVVKDGQLSQAKEVVAKFFAAINTKDGLPETVGKTLIPAILSFVKPQFKEDTEKTLKDWLKDRA